MRGQTNPDILGPKLQRRLRRNMTDAERLLWRHLCSRQLDGAKFRRQHPYFGYVLDFACLERRLVVELDGGQHAECPERDRERDAFLAQGGFRVMRFWNNDVMRQTSDVLEAILAVLQQRAEHPPQPGPPCQQARHAGARPAADQWSANNLPHPLEGEEADFADPMRSAPTRG